MTSGTLLRSVGGEASWSGVGRSDSGSTTGGPPTSGSGSRSPPPGPSSNPPTTRIWSAMMSPLIETRAAGSSELTTILSSMASIEPEPRAPSRLAPPRSSRQSTQLLGAAGPTPAAARALMLFEAFPSTGANAYCTSIGGVITCSAFDPSRQGSEAGGGSSGRVQQSTSPFASMPSAAQPATPVSPSMLSASSVCTSRMAAAGPSTSSTDAPARAAESAAVWADVRVAQFSPMSTTSAANPSSTVMQSATVMATLPRSEPPRSRNIVGHRPRSAAPQPVRDEVPQPRDPTGTLEDQLISWLGGDDDPHRQVDQEPGAPEDREDDEEHPDHRRVGVEVLGQAATHAGHLAIGAAAVQLAGCVHGAAFRCGIRSAYRPRGGRLAELDLDTEKHAAGRGLLASGRNNGTLRNQMSVGRECFPSLLGGDRRH